MYCSIELSENFLISETFKTYSTNEMKKNAKIRRPILVLIRFFTLMLFVSTSKISLSTFRNISEPKQVEVIISRRFIFFLKNIEKFTNIFYPFTNG
jgi:hypothetical protein